GYDLDELTPDHSVLSKARTRFGVTVYQAFFTEIVRQCEQAGLIRGDRLYVDSSLIEANASLESVGARALVAQLRNGEGQLAAVWRENAAEAVEASADSNRPAPASPTIPGPSAPPETIPVAPASAPAPAAPDGAPADGAPGNAPVGPHALGPADPPNG